MKKNINNGRERIPLLLEQLDDTFKGSKVALIAFFIVTLFTLVRSCIHIFAPDGGAGSIAGIDIAVEGGSNIISIFALWGLSQLLLGIVFLVVYIRYKGLIPFMYLLIVMEYLGRVLIGLAKPLIVLHTLPGAIGDYILIPLAIIMLFLSLKRPRS